MASSSEEALEMVCPHCIGEFFMCVDESVTEHLGMETKRGPETWKRPWVFSLAPELPCHARSNPGGRGQMILCRSRHVVGLQCWGQLICISSSMYPSML